MEHNKRFHLGVAEAAGNRELVRIMDLLLDKVSRVIFLYYSKASLEEHRPSHLRIVAALRSRDPVAARRAMRGHIETTGRSALTILRDTTLKSIRGGGKPHALESTE